ncbi:GNAT family N-acetyltransferase [Vineibacter terrae]|uniref:GNAT family N-acetyltransferase n=1 Tax=Vineibacter terrae TaxID=2586908 RepID=UPI002E363DFA|nr:GNAT family N-acetyltransferase [Vineibacter terrae]HEX2889138.1 GNAT family N-acetyltransferase [Vineibacter terrae]
MSDATIRRATGADRPWLITAMAGISDHERTLHDSRRPGADCADAYLAQIEAAIATRGGAILVAARGEERLGCIAFHVAREVNAAETPDSNVYGYVSDLYVAPAARRQGLASRLLAEAERHFRDAGLRRMRIGSLAANASAVGAYHRFGFEAYEVVLEKRLAP